MAGKSFRFRAQAALDMRLREEEQAQRDLARAQGDRAVARQRFQVAADAAREARQQVDAAAREPLPARSSRVGSSANTEGG